jgi:hypothetical protein
MTSPTKEGYVLRSSIHPSPFDLGVNYQGAIIEGSLQISPAREVGRVHIDKIHGQEQLQLSPYMKAGEHGLIWKFSARTDLPMSWIGFVGFWTDLGKTSTHFSLEVKPGLAPGGKVLFCESPFDALSSHWTHEHLTLLAREQEIQTNTLDTIPADLSQYDVVVLHGKTLLGLANSAIEILHRHIQTNGRLIVLADYFYRDSVRQANRLSEPYGIRFEDREYSELLCCARHIEDHSVTKGVQRLRWFRSSPILVKAPATILVHNPEDMTEALVACSGPCGNLFAIGCSRLQGLVGQGWPFNNGQLFASLLKVR